MPVLANTNCADRNLIRDAFLPFARPDYVEGMLIGDDLDSLLSAMYLHKKFGWPVAGVYCQYTHLWRSVPKEVFHNKLNSGKYFAADLDLYHPAVPSLGHHIIALDHTDDLPGHSHSLNPNALRGFSVRQGFTRKYPLATVHFLLWLFDEKDLATGAEYLVWLADSAFINAQHYRRNVEEWVGAFMPHPAFTRLLPDLQTLRFEQQLKETVLDTLATHPLCKPGRAKYRSQHLGLNGFQCQFINPDTQNVALQSLIALLSEISGWPPFPFPGSFSGPVEGIRKDVPVGQVTDTGLSFGEWLSREDVFSYAFTYRDRLNYTVLR